MDRCEICFVTVDILDWYFVRLLHFQAAFGGLSQKICHLSSLTFFVYLVPSLSFSSPINHVTQLTHQDFLSIDLEI